MGKTCPFFITLQIALFLSCKGTSSSEEELEKGGCAQKDIASCVLWCKNEQPINEESMNYQLKYLETLRGAVVLSASKSLSARALLVGALAGGSDLENLSDCDDTRVLRAALEKRLPLIDVEAAGTAMRFLTAYWATAAGEEHVLTGSPRMQQRPIGVLVSSLRQLGADIAYEKEEGYPPLRIRGRQLTGGILELPADISSQYISALLMIAPTLEQGLHLRLLGQIASRPYIEMTLAVMRRFGVEATWISDREIRVAHQAYHRDVNFRVEPDWSGASYWYELMALSSDTEARLFLPGLRQDSCQGDCIVATWFEALGVHTEYRDNGVVLTKTPVVEGGLLEWDFTSCPDLAQTFVVTCAVLGRPFRFSGLQSLRIKETDRVAALQTELQQLGITVAAYQDATVSGGNLVMEMLKPQVLQDNAAVIATYDDHRMAMAFAPVACRLPDLQIAHPEVVSKSYPNFWEDLLSVGVDIQSHG